MLPIDTRQPVAVTGATGYLAGHLVQQLLQAGVQVHAAVRDASNEAKLGHLKELAQQLPGDIQFFEADLLDDGSYADAIQDCKIVFHTASPFTLRVSDPERDLIQPAVDGTRNVLQEAMRQEQVERVVLTSSCAAMYGDNADIQSAPGGILTEEIWNTSSSPQHQAYSFSKTVAEQEAWKLLKGCSKPELTARTAYKTVFLHRR